MLTLTRVPQTVENLPAMRETKVWSLGQDRSLEKGRTTHSSILAWRIPWTEGWRATVSGVTKNQRQPSNYLSLNSCDYWFLSLLLKDFSLFFFPEENPKYSNGRLDNEYKQSSQKNYKRVRWEFSSGSVVKTALPAQGWVQSPVRELKSTDRKAWPERGNEEKKKKKAVETARVKG